MRTLSTLHVSNGVRCFIYTEITHFIFLLLFYCISVRQCPFSSSSPPAPPPPPASWRGSGACSPFSTSSCGSGTRSWSVSPSGTGRGRSLSGASGSGSGWSGTPSPAPGSGSGCRSVGPGGRCCRTGLEQQGGSHELIIHVLGSSESPKCGRRMYLKLHSKSVVVSLKKYNKVEI